MEAIYAVDLKNGMSNDGTNLSNSSKKDLILYKYDKNNVVIMRKIVDEDE
jgi:hypothetical protein